MRFYSFHFEHKLGTQPWPRSGHRFIFVLRMKFLDKVFQNLKSGQRCFVLS